MNTRHTLIASAMLAAGLASTPAHATLQSRLAGQAVYDTATNLTWVSNANLIVTTGFGLAYGVNYGNDAYGNPTEIYSNGTATWSGAEMWVAAMNAKKYLGYSDWRLPNTNPINPNGTTYNFNYSYDGSTDRGMNMSAPGTAYAGSKGSEMAYLFYNSLGDKAECAPTSPYSCVVQAGYGLTNTGPFTNFQNSYWSGTGYAANTVDSLIFSFGYGNQTEISDGYPLYVLAVRSGDVAPTPEPETYAMMLAGLVLVGTAKRRRG